MVSNEFEIARGVSSAFKAGIAVVQSIFVISYIIKQ